MTIKILLTLLLCLGLVFAFREWKQSRVLAVAIIMLSLGGIFFVWQSSASTRIANAIGVGRGADLVLYISAVISFVLMVSLVLRIKHLQEQITDLARAIALSSPHQPDGADHDGAAQ